MSHTYKHEALAGVSVTADKESVTLAGATSFAPADIDNLVRLFKAGQRYATKVEVAKETTLKARKTAE